MCNGHIPPPLPGRPKRPPPDTGQDRLPLLDTDSTCILTVQHNATVGRDSLLPLHAGLERGKKWVGESTKSENQCSCISGCILIRKITLDLIVVHVFIVKSAPPPHWDWRIWYNKRAVRAVFEINDLFCAPAGCIDFEKHAPSCVSIGSFLYNYIGDLVKACTCLVHRH